jgi:hypothetical protein
MAKPRIQIQLEVDTAGHADQIAAAIEGRLAGKPLAQRHALTRTEDFEGHPLLVVDLEFEEPRDRDALRGWLQSHVTAGPASRWTRSVSMSWHLCGHDEETPGPCSSGSFETWSHRPEPERPQGEKEALR